MFHSYGTPRANSRLQIAELKDHFDDDRGSMEYSTFPDLTPETDGTDLLLGRFESANRDEILAAIPSRPVVDRLIATYFAKVEMVTSMCSYLSRLSFEAEPCSGNPWTDFSQRGQLFSFRSKVLVLPSSLCVPCIYSHLT